MAQSRSISKERPMGTRSVRLLAVEAWRRAEAMGLVAPEAALRLDADDVSRLVNRVRDAGIARGPALRFDNVEPPSIEEAEALLRFVVAALEASPVPKFEWAAVTRVLEPEQLAALLNISITSLRRYASGERETPDDVAARLHHVALIVGDLAGAYNDVGIRRWFERTRTALNGRTPAALLAGDWNPDDAAPQKVRELARSLVAVSAT
jgi:transcriptional regulator with XRE-family HTH domain